jgi:mRNA interferase HigB
MQVLALSTLRAFWEKHPEARASLERWHTIAKAADWASMEEVKAAFSTAKGLNDERMRFEIAGGNYRMIVAFYFPIGWPSSSSSGRMPSMTASTF